VLLSFFRSVLVLSYLLVFYLKHPAKTQEGYTTPPLFRPVGAGCSCWLLNVSRGSAIRPASSLLAPRAGRWAEARRAQTEALSDEYSAAPELRQQNAAAEGAAAAAARKANGSNQAIIPINLSGALRLTSPKPRVRPRGGLEALEEQWRAAAEPEELVSLARRVEATVVPHHLYTGSRGIMSVLRQWGRCASSPAAPIGRHASPTTGGLAPTARLAPKRPRPAALRPWSPVSARSASADPFAFMPSELPDDERAQGRCRGSGRKRRSMRPARGHVDYRGQLYDLESD
jgi:hypothetical protein